MNTAVLTGRQVSQAMKVFIVSQAGKVADVTLQSSCQAEDESVIKVSTYICASDSVMDLLPQTLFCRISGVFKLE
jgi:hypothetical protein